MLAPDGDDPDAQVIKTHPCGHQRARSWREPLQVVAEIREAHNVELARTVGGDEVQLVLADDLISRILVQSTRQSGLSGVFSELLGFEGSEIYTHKVDGLAGLTFGEALGVFEDGALIGLAGEQDVQLNPPMDTLIGAADKAVVVARTRASAIQRARGERARVDPQHPQPAGAAGPSAC